MKFENSVPNFRTFTKSFDFSRTVLEKREEILYNVKYVKI